jgi:hypothetical protein
VSAASSGELLRSLLNVAANRRAPRGAHGGTRQYSDREPASVRIASAGEVERAPRPHRKSIRELPIADVEQILAHEVLENPDMAARIVDLLCLVAIADGRVDDAEREEISRVLGVLLAERLHAAVTTHLIRGSLREIERDGVHARVLAVSEALCGAHLVEEGLLIGIAMGFVSNGFSPEERAVIEAIAQTCGVSEERLARLEARVRERDETADD